MNTSFLCRVVQVILISIVMSLISSCQSISNDPSDLHDLAEQGDALAQFNLVGQYAGTEGTKNQRTAVMWFRKAAEQENANCQWALGVMYYFGQGVTQYYALLVEGVTT